MTRPVGAVTLGNLTFKQLEVACSSCERRGSYPVAKLIARRPVALYRAIFIQPPGFRHCSRASSPVAGLSR